MRLDPRNTDAHYALAGVLSSRGDVASAAEHFRTATELRPHYVAALVNLGVALVNLGDFPGAIQAFDEALETEPANMDAEYGLALALASAANQPKRWAIFRRSWKWIRAGSRCNFASEMSLLRKRTCHKRSSIIPRRFAEAGLRRSFAKSRSCAVGLGQGRRGDSAPDQSFEAATQ